MICFLRLSAQRLPVISQSQEASMELGKKWGQSKRHAWDWILHQHRAMRSLTQCWGLMSKSKIGVFLFIYVSGLRLVLTVSNSPPSRSWWLQRTLLPLPCSRSSAVYNLDHFSTHQGLQPQPWEILCMANLKHPPCLLIYHWAFPPQF